MFSSILFFAVLSAQLQPGPLPLEYHRPQGYLVDFLKHFDVPVSSQTLVFSKTSAQFPLIHPAAPRAIYFNDDIYVGWVRGGEILEVSYADPAAGARFFVVEQDPARKPKLEPREICLQCHESSRTSNIPGHLLRSVHPEASGHFHTNRTNYTTDHDSPFADRWGGWFLSAKTPLDFPHLGNRIFPTVEGEPRMIPSFDNSDWLTSSSDVVALMVLAHQVGGHNQLSWLNHESRAALELQHTMNVMDHQPDTVANWSPSTQRRIARVIESTVRYLTFADEAEFPQPIGGDTSFAEDFQKRGTLRKFNLEKRLFDLPLSYLVYSKSIDHLEPPVRTQFLARLKKVLLEEAGTASFARLDPAKAKEAYRVFSQTAR